MGCWRSTRNMSLLSELNHLFRCGSTEIARLRRCPPKSGAGLVRQSSAVGAKYL